MLKRLWYALRAFFFRPAVPSDPECRLDLDALAAELDLDRLATDAGSHQLPPSDARHADDAERKVQAAIHQRMSALTNATNERLGRYNAAIENGDINSQQQRLLNLTENTRLRLQSLLAETHRRLSTLKDEKQRYGDYFLRFKTEHRRDVDAHYPDSRLLHYSLVAVLLLLESLANGYFFARGSEFGLLGGISQAIVVGVANILPAFLIAGLVLLRYGRHVSAWKRYPARLATLLYLGWVLLFNLTVAHYRDLLAEQPQHAAAQALQRLAEQPLLLSDLNSWLLFLIGVLFALVAAYDGYKSDDPYPGYGSRQRRMFDIEAYYEAECRRLGAQVADLRRSYLDELTTLSVQVQDLYPHLFHLSEQKRALIERHRHCLNDLIAAGDALIHRYRQANRIARSTPPPAFFDQGWRSDRQFPLVGDRDDQSSLAQQKQVFDAFPAQVQQATNDIERLYRTFFSELQTVEPGLNPPATDH